MPALGGPRVETGVGIVLLTQYAEIGVANLLAALGPDGCGYLLKERIADVATFAEALRRVASRGSAFDTAVSSFGIPPVADEPPPVGGHGRR